MYVDEFEDLLRRNDRPAAKILLDILDNMKLEGYKRVDSRLLSSMRAKLGSRDIKAEGAQESSGRSCPIAEANSLLHSFRRLLV